MENRSSLSFLFRKQIIAIPKARLKGALSIFYLNFWVSGWNNTVSAVDRVISRTKKAPDEVTVNPY